VQWSIYLVTVSLTQTVKSGSINAKLPVIFSISRTLEITLLSTSFILLCTLRNILKLTFLFNSVFVQEIDFMSENIFDKAVKENSVVDFHDVMFKFTLDSFIL
jgi:hypothetical protein